MISRVLIVYIIFNVLVILESECVYAENVSEQTANRVAVNYMQSITGKNGLKAILSYKKEGMNGNIDFYVFNFLSFNGFVIVTGDNDLKPVIAYSTESPFDLNALENSGVNDWMSDIDKQIHEILNHNIKADVRISDLWLAYLNNIPVAFPVSSSVAPLLTTTWDQSQDIGGVDYYNSYCPFDSAANKHCPSGCVATAMAQIMKYWNSPITGISSHSYPSAGYGVLSANFGATTYNWNQMPNSVTATSSHDIDLLMYHCGISVDMDYSPTGSGAYVIGSGTGGQPTAQGAYVGYFGYLNTIQGLYAINFLPPFWIATLKGELDSHRPIQYAGTDLNPSVGGHSWVVDGYDANDNFHMNWGWGGVNNGYFSVTNLNPGSLNFTSNLGAVIGIWPGDLSGCVPTWNLTGNQSTNFKWQASDNISSTMAIQANSKVVYAAENLIVLSPGFIANNNSTFNAVIQPCMAYKIASETKSTIPEDETDLSILPNPAIDQVTVKFNMIKDNNVAIKIFDLLGKPCKTIIKSFFNEGEHDLVLNVSDLPEGVYFVILQTSDYKEMQKMIKVN